ncbi:TetR family transcriptional regulator [Actinomyces radicidentis]|uniref:TetR/AcrR family transcriptional regulator n=1 Tax=Actinomyces radicidentis TaxID=111015 RepID=UPI0028E9CBBA|nr:TetR family transcriptional regulator [Actinomyces radicidentis]
MNTTTGSAPTARAAGGLRASRARRTRDAIQASALRLAHERGYDATTVEDVAADAGVSRRTVFNYFPTKIDMFVHGPLAPEAEAVEAFIASDGDLLDDLGALIASADPRDGDDAEDFRRLRAVFRENPEIIVALQPRVRLFHSVIRAAIAQRLGAQLSDPRVRAASGLAHLIQKTAVELWAGDDCEAGDAAAPSGGAAPAPASVADAVPVVITSLREVLSTSPRTTQGLS